MFKFIMIFGIVLVATVAILHQAFAPDEDGEYLPTAFQPSPTPTLKPTIPPTAAPHGSIVNGVLTCYPHNLAPDQGRHFTIVSIIDVPDGDTVIVDNGAGHHVAKLWGLDAPELNQKHGPDAREALLTLLPVGSTAHFYEVRYYPETGETFGIFSASIGLINLQILGNGWAYGSPDPDAADNTCIEEFTLAAQKQRLGIWRDSLDGDQRPWEYRSINTPTPTPTLFPTPTGIRRIPGLFDPGTLTPVPTPTLNPSMTPTPTPTPTVNPDINHLHGRRLNSTGLNLS